jgi:phenylacetaldehyde dehydrogenase
VAAAVDTAAKAQPGWAALDDQERCAALMRAADAIDAHADELAYVVSREQGKTMNGLGARYEAAGCAAWVRATASTPLPVEVPGAWFSPRGTGRSRPRRTSCSGW